jgi:hypothetical protein
MSSWTREELEEAERKARAELEQATARLKHSVFVRRYGQPPHLLPAEWRAFEREVEMVFARPPSELRH